MIDPDTKNQAMLEGSIQIKKTIYPSDRRNTEYGAF